MSYLYEEHVDLFRFFPIYFDRSKFPSQFVPCLSERDPDMLPCVKGCNSTLVFLFSNFFVRCSEAKLYTAFVRSLIPFMALSLAAHLSAYGAVVATVHPSAPRHQQPVKLTVITEEPKPPKDDRANVKRPPKKKIASHVRTDKPIPKKNVQPIFGYTKNEVVSDGPLDKALAVPVGNTLMMEDDGKRSDNAEPLSGDLSSDPILIRESIKTPAYTEEALHANLEGQYNVDVLVNESGTVDEVDLQGVVGYGMDDRILAACKSARFHPRRDRFGHPLSGWTTIKFQLEIP